MQSFRRYAVYYAPDGEAWARFCAHWLGWDARRGCDLAHPQIDGLPLPVEDITATPRKYGIHGTIKPPFRLVEGAGPAALHHALGQLAASLPPVEMPGLMLTRLGDFLALRPEGPAHALARLSATVVRTLDHFRAPLSPDDMLRRHARQLTPTQMTLLRKWGYPFVMEEFHFHITLTGKMDDTQIAAVEAALAPHLVPLLPRPFRFDTLCLFGEAQDGQFHLLHRYPLGTGALGTG